MKKPDGGDSGRSLHDAALAAGANQLRQRRPALGRAADQGWSPGTTQSSAATPAQLVAEAHIEIVQNPPDVADTDIRVAAIRVFPVTEPARTGRAPVREQAVAADTNPIGVELEFSHAPLGRAAKVPVDCYFFWPDGQTSPPSC